MSRFVPERARQTIYARNATKLEIGNMEVLEGPNIWWRFPVCVASIRLSKLPRTGTTYWKEVVTRISESIPSPAHDRRSGQMLKPATFFECTAGEDRESQELWVARILLRTVQTLHALCRSSLTFSRIAQSSEKEDLLIVVECEEEALSRACFELAAELCQAALNGEQFDLAPRLQQLKSLADDVCLGATTSAIVAAARRKGIPVQRLDSESLVQLGHGVHQRRIQASHSDQTGVIAEAISTDKHLTKSLLRQVGLPVPEGRPVHNREDAWKAACEIGLPVVVKPRNGDYGVGVSLNLSLRESILDAYDEARRHRDQVMV